MCHYCCTCSDLTTLTPPSPLSSPYPHQLGHSERMGWAQQVEGAGPSMVHSARLQSKLPAQSPALHAAEVHQQCDGHMLSTVAATHQDVGLHERDNTYQGQSGYTSMTCVQRPTHCLHLVIVLPLALPSHQPSSPITIVITCQPLLALSSYHSINPLPCTIGLGSKGRVWWNKQHDMTGLNWLKSCTVEFKYNSGSFDLDKFTTCTCTIQYLVPCWTLFQICTVVYYIKKYRFCAMMLCNRAFVYMEPWIQSDTLAHEMNCC